MYVCRGGKEPCRTPLFAKDTVCDEQPGAALIRVNGLVDFRPGAVLVKGALCSIICGACRAPVGVVDEQENGIFFFTTAVIDSCYVPTVMMNPVDADVAAVTGETFSEERVPVWSTWVPRPFDMDITDQMPQVEADPQLLPQVEADPQLQKQTQPQNQQPQKQQPKKPQTQKPPLPPRKAPRKEAAQLPRNAALVEGPLEMELDASLIPWDRVLDCVKLIPALVTLLKVFDKADIQRDCRSMHVSNTLLPRTESV